MKARALLFYLGLFSYSGTNADIEIESYGRLTLDEIPVHTVMINNFQGNTVLFDADAQQVIGMLSVGNGANAMEVDRANGVVHVAETYLSRHTRGERTDVITTHDIRTLSATGEIVIPPKHASGSPMRHYSGILRDDDGAELMLVSNITPAVSISIANLKTGEFLGELSTAGCGLIYPVSGLRFLQLCGDGSAQLISLNGNGSEKSRIRSEFFFDLQDDPLMEKPVQTTGGWLFNTFKGKVFSLNVSGNKITVEEVFSISDESGEWRVGGMQPLAYHRATNLLLALMHQGGDNTHKDPGTEVWYYDLNSERRVHRLTLENPTTSIQVSQDDQPVLYGGSTIVNRVDTYDLKTGNVTGAITNLGFPTILQNF